MLDNSYLHDSLVLGCLRISSTFLMDCSSAFALILAEVTTKIELSLKTEISVKNLAFYSKDCLKARP